MTKSLERLNVGPPQKLYPSDAGHERVGLNSNGLHSALFGLKDCGARSRERVEDGPATIRLLTLNERVRPHG